MSGLGDFHVAGVLRADDFSRAKRFYTEVLGLKMHEEREEGPTTEGTFETGDGSSVSIYERPGMPAPQNTALGFSVPPDRFSSVVEDLRSKGVTFEEYDLPEIGLKTVGGIIETEQYKAAWFRDSEGNIVSIYSM